MTGAIAVSAEAIGTMTEGSIVFAMANPTPEVHPEEFTLTTAEARFAEVGDLWAPMSSGPRLDLQHAMERIGRIVRETGKARPPAQ